MVKTDQKLAYPKRARDLSIDDRRHLLGQLEWARNLSEVTMDRLVQGGVALDFRRRRFIYRAGDPADSVFAILRGRVKLCRIEPDSDREAVIDILSQGSLFGESALFSTAGLRENSAIAYEQALLLKIPAGAFQESMVEDQRLHNYTFRLIGQRLENAERRLADFALNAIPRRLERLLAEFSERYGVAEDDGVLIDIPLPHREIASIVGSTRESVTVRLNAMKREGTIDFVNRKILVKRPTSTLIS
ncbi:MAG TPA: Crp/Fnr family transcriptional regulator [Pyrinomonadaceae bacterium]|jgi:CRP/FNR family transcriptional regulator|nr:Crp/Fnr family transcriptional regulator [Pyrinomonadaceae bacterium]